MSDGNKPAPDAPPESSDETEFAALDAYNEALRSGDVRLQAELRRKNPGLVEILACLEGLDSLAGTPTVIFDGADSSGIALDAAVHSPTDFPRAFGKYELKAEVGRGGMGVVYKAWQEDLNRPVALKMILSSHLASHEDVRRFYDEARAAGSLRHRHIVGVHEVGQVHGQHYFAMDFVQGPSLAEVLAKDVFPAEEAAKFMIATARAIDYLHQHGIVHRDLKPGNILIDDEGQPLVTDFGLAKVFNTDEQLTRTGTIVGTPSYMAPEQAAGNASVVTAASDVYSLGAILYEMLTGRPPFKEVNPLDTLVQVLEGEPTLPSKFNRSIPRELELICLRCLEKRAEKRYATAAALADDLERYLRRDPVEARPVGLPFRLRRWARREPALVSRLGALLLTVLVVQIKYNYDGYDWPYHLRVMSLLAIWGLTSFVYQWMLNQDWLAEVTRFAWSATDATVLTILLLFVDSPGGPLLIGYPMVIAAAGMFFRVRLIVFTTLYTLAAFGILAWTRPAEFQPVQYGVIYAVVLAVLGFVIGYQVYRVRVLSRYYESQR